MSTKPDMYLLGYIATFSSLFDVANPAYSLKMVPFLSFKKLPQLHFKFFKTVKVLKIGRESFLYTYKM